MKTIIHVNQSVLRTNKKTKQYNPPITVKTYKTNEYVNCIEFNGHAKLIYSPEKPLSCGATVWIECDNDCILTYKKEINNDGPQTSTTRN